MKVRYYRTATGRSPVEEFLADCSKGVQTEFVDAVTLLESGLSLSMPLSRPLPSIAPSLHELRFRDRGGQVRFFYFMRKGDAIYMVHACRKKTQKISKDDRAVILKRLKEI